MADHPGTDPNIDKELPMRPSYCLTVDVAQPFDQAVQTLRDTLAAEGMGVVSEVDVQATLKNKMNLDVASQKMLGICNPKLAHAMLEAEPEIGAMLPCSGFAREIEPGRTQVVLQDPMVVAQQTANADVRRACEQAHLTFRRVVDRLMLAGT